MCFQICVQSAFFSTSLFRFLGEWFVEAEKEGVKESGGTFRLPQNSMATPILFVMILQWSCTLKGEASKQVARSLLLALTQPYFQGKSCWWLASADPGVCYKPLGPPQPGSVLTSKVNGQVVVAPLLPLHRFLQGKAVVMVVVASTVALGALLGIRVGAVHTRSESHVGLPIHLG